MTTGDPLHNSPTRVVQTPRPVLVDSPQQKDPFHPGRRMRVASWRALGKSLFTSLCFLFQTEVHVYAFAVAVNVLISFYPFLVAMILICHRVLHWPAAVDIIIQTVASYFPDDFGFNAGAYLRSASGQKFSWVSLFLLFFTANGIFVPLEVAFNRIWRTEGNRSFLRNQIVSIGLIFLCGALFLASVSLTTLNSQFLTSAFGASKWSATLQSVGFRIVALPVTMLTIFLIYWLLPNARIPVQRLLPSAAAVAILLQVSEYVNLLTWPWLRDKLKAEVPPFVQSISIVFWSFSATLIILAGAEWAARVRIEGHEESHSHPDRLH